MTPGPEETKFRAWLEAEIAAGLAGVKVVWNHENAQMTREEKFRAMNEFNAAPRTPWTEAP